FLLLFMSRPPPARTLFPYTTLFRSARDVPSAARTRHDGGMSDPHALSHAPLATGGVLGVFAHPDDETLGAGTVLATAAAAGVPRSEEHTSELQSRENLVCRLLLEKK